MASFFSDVSAVVTDQEMKTSLETIEGMGVVDVTREGYCGGYTWTIHWNTVGGDRSEISFVGFGDSYFVILAICINPLACFVHTKRKRKANATSLKWKQVNVNALFTPYEGKSCVTFSFFKWGMWPFQRKRCRFCFSLA